MNSVQRLAGGMQQDVQSGAAGRSAITEKHEYESLFITTAAIVGNISTVGSLEFEELPSFLICLKSTYKSRRQELLRHDVT